WSSSRSHLLRMTRAAVRRLTENRAESAHAHRLLIEDRREIVLRALASTWPPSIGANRRRRPRPQTVLIWAASSVPYAGSGRRSRAGTSRPGRARECHLQLERPSPHDGLSSRATPGRGANVRLSMQLMMLRFGTGLSRETDRFDTAIAIPVRVV